MFKELQEFKKTNVMKDNNVIYKVKYEDNLIIVN